MSSPLATLIAEVDRVLYSEGQFLGAADFQDEQAYHRAALGRHEIGGHTWGVVVGLDLVETPDASDPQFVDPMLGPGLAVDGYGRQVVSFAATAIDAELFASFTGDGHHQIYLEYDETTSRPAAAGFADCADGSATRTLEGYRLVVDPVQPIATVVVDGVAATAADIPADRSVPYQELPVEPPLLRWPIRLGSLHWDGTVGRFRPAAAGRLAENRDFAGAVAASVLSPTTTLRVAPRAGATDPDAAEFATVEGRLRAEGRFSAERDIWLEGGATRFAYTAASEENTVIALGRDHGSGAQHRLRLRLGDDPKAENFLSIGTKSGGGETTIMEVRADDRVRVPDGTIDLGTVDRQGIELSGGTAAIGTQPGSVFVRTPGELAFYRGGVFSATQRDPGAGGLLQAVLDSDGSLDFGRRTRQMLHLWSSSGQHQYGIGVQPWTLYFRTDADVCWFKRGSHVEVRGGAGGGGTLQMQLHEDASLDVVGGVHSFTDLTADRSLRVRGFGAGAVESVVRVQTQDFVQVNNGSSPQPWTFTFPVAFTEVYAVYAAMSGFSLLSQIGSATPTVAQDLASIPQHVWVVVDSRSTTAASGRSFCAQSDATRDGDNVVAFTVVAIGRVYS